jgi:hypothetical protein
MKVGIDTLARLGLVLAMAVAISAPSEGNETARAVGGDVWIRGQKLV